MLLNLDSRNARSTTDVKKDPQMELLFGNCIFQHNLLRLDLLRNRFKYDESGFGGKHIVGGKLQLRRMSFKFGVIMFCALQVEKDWTEEQVKHFLSRRLSHVANLTYSDIIVLC